ncbi:MAG: WYL domain-containing protein [Aestuariivita sp.]|nr:WYL domain-containing protein [Aestuariivita sp.]MCY4202484.1 WYL domain-containing protein [Aestuariivita sp.]
MSEESERQIKWTVKRRMEFIEFRLFWQGSINRKDLCDTFGLSLPQASLDLRRYSQQAKRNLYYDKKKMTYLRGKNFQPHYLAIDAENFVTRLHTLEQGAMSQADSWIGIPPACGTIPRLGRGIAAKTLQAVLEAIRQPYALRVVYQSMSAPTSAERWIEPHALGFDGLRWHVRAFCRRYKCFKDFALSRVLEIMERQAALSEPSNDSAWYREIVFEIVPHPHLSAGQREVIELDYGMVDGGLKYRVRRAMAGYALQHLRISLDKEPESPQAHQVVLRNADEIRNLLDGLQHPENASDFWQVGNAEKSA